MNRFLAALTLGWMLALPAAAAPLRVVATFTILGDMARQIAGEDIALITLVGPDGDAHVYEPRPRDIAAMAHADVILANGLGFEAWLPRLIAASGGHARLITASDGLVPLHIGHDPDPHAWQDLRNGAHYVRMIGKGLAQSDPAHAASWEASAERYAVRLETLDAGYRRRFAALPPEERRLVTTHDAFGYFARAYGFQIVPLEGVRTGGQGSAGALADTIDQVRRTGVRTVFLENMGDARLAEALRHDAGVQIGGTLYSDALSPPDGPAATYEMMFRHNVETLLTGIR